MTSGARARARVAWQSVYPPAAALRVIRCKWPLPCCMWLRVKPLLAGTLCAVQGSCVGLYAPTACRSSRQLCNGFPGGVSMAPCMAPQLVKEMHAVVVSCRVRGGRCRMRVITGRAGTCDHCASEAAVASTPVRSQYASALAVRDWLAGRTLDGKLAVPVQRTRVLACGTYPPTRVRMLGHLSPQCVPPRAPE